MVFIFHLKHPRLQVFLFFICVGLLFNLVWKRNLLTVLYMARINNRLLTEHEGRTGEYWPEVMAVRTERSEVRTATTEGQYSPVRPKQARLVSGLLYGTLFLIVKCNFKNAL